MAQDINRITLVGRLGTDPVLRETTNGLPVASFPVATSRRVRAATDENGGSQWAEETDWHRIVAWGKSGQSCQSRLKKGDPIYLEGSLRNRRYEDSEGKVRYSCEIHLERFIRFSRARAAAVEDVGDEVTSTEPDPQPSPRTE